MRIAFVGKGGSGKSTVAALFALWACDSQSKPLFVFDADINMHLNTLLGMQTPPPQNHLSHPEVETTLKTWLINENEIPSVGMFRKSCPPTRKSHTIAAETYTDSPLSEVALQRGRLSSFTVGTYQEKDIGAGCYHTNLAILENILSHTDDKDMLILADMVAGTDAFAGTLHAQFDLICLVVEPTQQSVSVYSNYKALHNQSLAPGRFCVVGNKIEDDSDREFIQEAISEGDLLGFLHKDKHIKQASRTGESLNWQSLEASNQELLAFVMKALVKQPDLRNKRLEVLREIHKKYISRPFITERFGDLSHQIDYKFQFPN